MLGITGESEEIWGIPGTPTDHHSASYAMTEEFTAVYRLHPLIPDEYRFHSLADPTCSVYKSFQDIQGNGTRAVLLHPDVGMDNVLYIDRATTASVDRFSRGSGAGVQRGIQLIGADGQAYEIRNHMTLCCCAGPRTNPSVTERTRRTPSFARGFFRPSMWI